jgi:hypothetical protein
VTAFIQRLGFSTVGSGTSTISGTLTNGVTFRQGSILVAVALGDNAGNHVTSITDASGNVYTQDYAIPSGATGNRALEIWRCQDPLAVTNGTVMHVNFSSNVSTGAMFIADLFSRLGNVDSTNYNYAPTTTTSFLVNVFPFATDGVAFGVCAPNGPESTLTVAGPFTATGGAALASPSGISGLSCYLDNPGTSTVQATFTASTAHTGVLAMVTYPLQPIGNKGAFFAFM